MDSQIIKPITLIREDFISDLVKLINDSPLPAFVIESILKDMYNEMKIIAQKQLESDKINYNQKLEP